MLRGFVARVSEIRLCDSAVSTRVCSETTAVRDRVGMHFTNRVVNCDTRVARVLARWVDRRPASFSLATQRIVHQTQATRGPSRAPSHAAVEEPS